MNKTEFLDSLRRQLSGHMQDGKVAAHVQYYREYIEEQVRRGRSEEDVLLELGEPRLIAKTLLDTDQATDNTVCDDMDIYYGEDQHYQTYEGNTGEMKHRSYKLDLSTWYGKAIVLLIAALVIIGLIVVIGTVLPVILMIGVVMYLISKIQKK